MSEIIYSKYANERASQFSLRTDIVRMDNGGLVVYKTPLCEAARAHVKNIYAVGEALNKQYAQSRFQFNRCQMTDTGVELEFIDDITLENVADKLLYAGKVDEVETLLLQVIEELYKTKNKMDFHKTDKFVEAFGEVDLASDLPCAAVSDIDMIMSNIMQGEQWTVIDYEWSFDFPVPVQFIVYRLLFYYLYASPVRSVLHERNLMQKAGISDNDVDKYKEMERHFQAVYVLQEADKNHYTPLRDMYRDISPGTADVRELFAKVKSLARTKEGQRDLSLAIDESIRATQADKELLQAKEAQISAMENTKVWKVYSKYREIKEK